MWYTLRPVYPLALICRVLHIPRSQSYARQHRAVQTTAVPDALRIHIEQIAAAWPTYGYRRVTANCAASGLRPISA